MNKSCIIPVTAIALFSLVCAAAPKNGATSSDALLQARIYKYQFRSGQYDVAQRATDVLQDALKSDPENIELLKELGTAYLMRMTRVSHPGGKKEELMPAMRGAVETFERAAALSPDDAYAMAGRGMSRIIVSRGDRRSDEIRNGIADLNAGIERDPTSVPTRLMRAFTLLALPIELRDTAAVEVDLQFLANIASGTRAADVLAVLLADIQLETGLHEEANRSYERIAQKVSIAGDEARSRLAAIKTDENLAMEEVARLRASLGVRCTMCHGQ